MRLVRYKNLIECIKYPTSSLIFNSLNLTYLEFIQAMFPQKINDYVYARKIETNVHTVYDKLIIMPGIPNIRDIHFVTLDYEEREEKRALEFLSKRNMIFFNSYKIKVKEPETIKLLHPEDIEYYDKNTDFTRFELASELYPTRFTLKLKRSIFKGKDFTEKEIVFHSSCKELNIKKLLEIPEIRISYNYFYEQLPNFYLK